MLTGLFLQVGETCKPVIQCRIASQSASPEGCSCVTRFCFGRWFNGVTVWAVLSHGHCKTQPDERLPGLLPKNKK